ncbi:MAG TPA: glycoside hydrolase family 25 protein [Candidatus Faeciplasma pullistercoris]|uniref:Glycoside hydrolase family 25 protein n=1 Tax=Candidatus Faeciplasma pullistercoris TaxID=2840800 RepID=A0A9D1GUY8_9FIRM|nr:glycoside hydrolase family 25 protein [Candidatus Faeciplasma pullistercoris]
MQIKGIDISRHQRAGEVNFKKLRELGYDFVMIRAGYGKFASQKDTAFEQHYSEAVKAGLYAGAYHYSYALNTREAIEEADCFLTWIKGTRLEYPVAFDIEDECQKKLTNAQRTDIALAFMQRVEDAGYYTMLYSSAYWLGSKLDMKRLSHFDVWCAAYVGSQENIKKYYDGPYGMWQYSSDTVLPTVYRSRLDQDYAYKDYARIIRDAGLNHLDSICRETVDLSRYE